MRSWHVRSSNGRQSRRKACYTWMPSCWRLLLITLAAVAAFNLYVYNYQKIRRAAYGKNIVRTPSGEPAKAPAKQVQQPADTNALAGATGGGGGGGEAVDGGKVTPTSTGENKITEPGTSPSIEERSHQQRPPLPLGRDQPLVIRLRVPVTAASPADAAGAGVHYDADSLVWPDEGDEHASTVLHFPCSLTEVDQFPGLGAALGGAFSGGGTRRLGQQQEKAWSTSGHCVISCTTKAEGQSTHMEVEEKNGVRGSSVEGLNHCPRALQACELYQECTHVLLPPLLDEQQERESPEEGFALLMHAPSMDGSMAAVEAAAVMETGGGGGSDSDGGRRPRWGGINKGFTLEARSRTYYVVSFGGSGSKMLGGWLSERGKSMVREVYHIHDPVPADTLFAKETHKRVSPGRVGRGRDFRGYDFPEGDFPRGGSIVQDIDSYRVVLIFKDPAEALVSRYFYNHCKNLRGADCGGSEKAFPSLERYAEESGDRLNMEAFYDNYCNPSAANGSRNYPVVCVNYHKMWDNRQALVAALGLPAEEASKMPTRTETVRNDQTSARRGEPFTLAIRERLRVKHASLSAKIFEAPAVAIV